MFFFSFLNLNIFSKSNFFWEIYILNFECLI
jgi:hypothetical protein